MPLEVYDSEGNQVEGVLAPEEVTALNAQLEETKAKLSKLENKDFNFRRLEQMTEEEKAKLSATEIALKQQQEQLEKDQKAFKESFVGDIKKDVFEKMIGDDEELKKKVEHHFNRFPESKTAQSRTEIEQLVQDALTLSTGGRAKNPLIAAMNQTGSVTTAVKETKLSDDVMEVAKKLGLSEADFGK